MSTDREGPSLDAALGVRDRCLCLHVQRAARALARRFDEALRPHGLTHGQFSLMMSLVRGDGRSIGRISAPLAMDRTTVTAMLKPLARRGLVRIAVDPEDRRSRLVHLTPAGRRALGAALPAWTETHDELDRMIAASDPARLRADLRSLAV
jgi:DNA-binding MarR family transcriptional regulator